MASKMVLTFGALFAAALSSVASAQTTLGIDIDKLPPSATVRADTSGSGLPSAVQSGTASSSGALRLALDLGNLGKVDAPVSVYVGQCADQSVRVTLAAQGQEPPPECNRRKIGAFWLSKTHQIAIHYPGTLATGGMSTTTKVLIGAGGGAVAVAALAAGGGSSSNDSPANGSSSGGTSFASLTGTYSGKASLATDARTCAGSSPEYNEKAVVSLNASGSGTVTLQDTAGFDRPYTVSTSSSGFSSSGTFSLFGSSIPGTLSGSFSGTTLTLIEGTTYGNCINTYKSTLTKQ